MLISTMVLFNRGSSVPENDRLASIAAELQFRSLSRHSSPTEEREGDCHNIRLWPEYADDLCH